MYQNQWNSLCKTSNSDWLRGPVSDIVKEKALEPYSHCEMLFARYMYLPRLRANWNLFSVCHCPIKLHENRTSLNFRIYSLLIALPAVNLTAFTMFTNAILIDIQWFICNEYGTIPIKWNWTPGYCGGMKGQKSTIRGLWHHSFDVWVTISVWFSHEAKVTIDQGYRFT